MAVARAERAGYEAMPCHARLSIPPRSVLESKRPLVTDGAGFIGSALIGRWIVRWLDSASLPFQHDSMRSNALFLFRLLAAAIALETGHAATGDIYLKPFTDTENGTKQIAEADPGQVIKIYNLWYVGEGEIGAVGPPQYSGLHSVIRMVSLTGATAYAEPGYDDEIQVMKKAPSTVIYPDAFGAPFIFYVKVNPFNREGHAAPVVLKVAVDLYNNSGDGNTPPHVHEICTYTLPVSQIPKLHVAVNVNTPDPKALHPGESGLFQYTTDAAGANMDGLIFKAQVPKGTTLQSMYPAGGVQTGREITWKPGGTLTSFAAGFSAKVNARPGTANATTTFGGVAKVESFARSAQQTKKIPITGFDNGKIVYSTPTGTNGPVTVDQTYAYVLTDWDWDGGDVDVELEGKYVDTGTAAKPYGEFTVPVFKDADLEAVLTAKQTKHPVDTIVTGEVDAVVELLHGNAVMVGSDSVIVRKLRPGGKVATGEVDPTDTAFADQLGHLRLDGPSSAVVLHYAARQGFGSDGRLVFARNGDVAVYGGVRPHKIKFPGIAALAYTPQNFTAYDTSHKTGVNNLGSILSDDTRLNGYCFVNGDLLISGQVILDGAICYTTGNVTISGELTGSGTFICLGNVTVQNPGKLTLKTPTATSLTLGVGGTLSVLP
jgi:hypothetical protein